MSPSPKKSAAIVGSDTAIGAALARGMADAGFAVAESVSDDCHLVLYCHDAAQDAEGHISTLDTLCRSLAETHTSNRQVRVCVFTPANACGESPRGIRETTPLVPRCRRDFAYAQAEMLLHAWYGMSHTPIIPMIFRHGELYCAPDADHPLAGHVNACLRKAQNHQPLTIPGLGIQKRTLTHLDDFAAAVASILSNDFLPSVVNIPGETMTIADYMNKICDRYGVEPVLDKYPFDDDLPWGIGDRVLSAALFKSESTDFRPQHKFITWLAKIAD